MLPSSTDQDRLLTPEEAAEHLGVGVQLLNDWRYRRVGPAFCKLGHRTVRYRAADLDAYVRRSRVAPGSGDAA